MGILFFSKSKISDEQFTALEKQFGETGGVEVIELPSREEEIHEKVEKLNEDLLRNTSESYMIWVDDPAILLLLLKEVFEGHFWCFRAFIAWHQDHFVSLPIKEKCDV